MMAIPRRKSSSTDRPAFEGPAPPNNFILFSPLASRGRMSLSASSVAISVRARQHQGIGRQHRKACARLAEATLSTVARTQAMGDETGQRNWQAAIFPHNETMRDR